MGKQFEEEEAQPVVVLLQDQECMVVSIQVEIDSSFPAHLFLYFFLPLPQCQ